MCTTNQIIKTNESLYSVNLSDILSFDLNNSNETYISNDSNELKCQIKSSDRFYNKIIFIVKSSGSNKINKYFHASMKNEFEFLKKFAGLN